MTHIPNFNVLASRLYDNNFLSKKEKIFAERTLILISSSSSCLLMVLLPDGYNFKHSQIIRCI
jgi:hypothetical protein